MLTAAVAVLLAVLVPVLVFRGGPPDSPPETKGDASAGWPSPAPSPSPSARAGSSCGALSDAECRLLGRLPAAFADVATCAQYVAPNSDEVASLRCQTPATGRIGANPGVDLYAIRFTSQAVMDTHIEKLATDYAVPAATDGGCFDLAGPGRGPWRLTNGTTVIGKVLCYSHRGAARIFWSYDGDAILLAVVAAGPDVPNLVRWWSAPNHSAVLR